jgi:hypothetical protein
MLISMPTDTSTIFGVFQAIVALHFNSDEIRPTNNLTLNEKFASEIFLTIRSVFLCCIAIQIHDFLRPIVKTMTDQQVQGRLHWPDAAADWNAKTVSSK